MILSFPLFHCSITQHSAAFLMREKIVAALLVIPSVTRDLTSDVRFATPLINREVRRFARNDS
jgi:hypothetical protein